MQLDCLDDRNANDAAAVFVKSVRETWSLPETYVSRLEAQERAQIEQGVRNRRSRESRAEGPRGGFTGHCRSGSRAL